MSTLMQTPSYVIAASLKNLVGSLGVFGRHYGRTIRVRRKGFGRDVRRGDDLPWRTSSDGLAHVIRRSRHSLWLEVDRPAFDEHAIVSMRLPERYRP